MTMLLPLLLLGIWYCLHVGALRCDSPGYVCGTNGRTYKTVCHMMKARNRDPDLEVLYPGSCLRALKLSLETSGSPARQLECSIGQPVCGTDGRTYENKCLLKYNTKRNPALRLKHVGPCDHQHNADISQDYSYVDEDPNWSKKENPFKRNQTGINIDITNDAHNYNNINIGSRMQKRKKLSETKIEIKNNVQNNDDIKIGIRL